jgi:hypothetical protein
MLGAPSFTEGNVPRMDSDTRARHIIGELVEGLLDGDKTRIRAALASLRAGELQLLRETTHLMAILIMRPYRGSPVTLQVMRGTEVVGAAPSADNIWHAGQITAARICTAYANNDDDLVAALLRLLIDDENLFKATMAELTQQYVRVQPPGTSVSDFGTADARRN